MDRITELIKNEIKEQYQSVRQFSEASGIPYSTLTNCLTKGVGGTAYNTVTKICSMLNISQAYEEELLLFDDRFREIFLELVEMDDQGIQTLNTVMDVEVERCMQNPEGTAARGFNGVGFARQADNEEYLQGQI